MKFPYTIRWYRNFLGRPELIYEGKTDWEWIHFKIALATAGLIGWEVV